MKLQATGSIKQIRAQALGERGEKGSVTFVLKKDGAEVARESADMKDRGLGSGRPSARVSFSDLDEGRYEVVILKNGSTQGTKSLVL